jgi:hypothetical protein
VVRLESSLAKNAYDYELPETSFTANCSYKHFVMAFDPKVSHFVSKIMLCCHYCTRLQVSVHAGQQWASPTQQ